MSTTLDSEKHNIAAEETNHLYLQDSRNSMMTSDTSPLPVRVSPSQLEARIPSGLDKEKHEDMAALMRVERNGMTEDADDDDDNDDDEFGDADETDQAVSQYLQKSRLSIYDTTPSKIQVTPSQLQALMPAGLDNEKHEEITDLIDDSVHLGHSDDCDHGDDDDDEFGDANDTDQAVQHYLHNSQASISDRDSVSQSPIKLFHVTPSQLQARIPAGLDNEKHEEISALMDTTPAKVRDDDDDDDDDEFGDAEETDQAVSLYLQKSRDSMHSGGSSDSVRMSRPRLQVTPSQLQALMPAGLDNEKHEEIGALIDSRHELDSDDDEFGDAADDDVPSSQYLKSTRASFLEGAERRIVRVTPSQLQAKLPSGLDTADHQEIGDLVAVNTRETGNKNSVDDDDDNDDDEFGYPTELDTDVGQYMKQKRESMQKADRFPPARVTPSQLQAFLPSGLDGGKHEDIGPLVRSMHDTGDEQDDNDEFGDAEEGDAPVESFLRASSHSFGGVLSSCGSSIPGSTHHTKNDDFFESNHKSGGTGTDEVEYENLRDEDYNDVYQNLDTEKHDDLGDLMKSTHRSTSSDEEDCEFEIAGENDRPVRKFLLAQNSVHEDDDLLDDKNNYDSRSTGLDNESHNDLGGFLGNAISLDEDEFVSSAMEDRPNQIFLDSQVSVEDEEVLNYDDSDSCQKEVEQYARARQDMNRLGAR